MPKLKYENGEFSFGWLTLGATFIGEVDLPGASLTIAREAPIQFVREETTHLRIMPNFEVPLVDGPAYYEEKAQEHKGSLSAVRLFERPALVGSELDAMLTCLKSLANAPLPIGLLDQARRIIETQRSYLLLLVPLTLNGSWVAL